jgi:hypothetical protein
MAMVAMDILWAPIWPGIGAFPDGDIRRRAAARRMRQP